MAKQRPSKRQAAQSGASRTESAAGVCLRTAFESCREAIGVFHEGMHLFANPAYLALFGLPPGTDLAGSPATDLVAPESRAGFASQLARAAGGAGAAAAFQTRGRRADGTAFDLEVSLSPCRHGSDELTVAVLRDVTARLRAEHEGVEHGAALQQIMDTASVAIFLVDKAGRITHANRRMGDMFGRPVGELIGSEYVSLVHPSEREIGRRKMLALLASEIESVDLERRYWRSDGSGFWGHLVGRRHHDAEGNEIGLIGVITDVDDRRRAQERLQESESRLRTVMEHAPATILQADRAGRITFVNWPMPGLTREQIIGSLLTDWVTPAQRGVVLRVLEQVFTTGERQEYETEGPGPDGSVREYSVRAMPVVVDGTIESAVFVATDISERKRVEAALRESEERYRQLFESESDAIFLIDNETGRLLMANAAATAMYGYTREQLLALTNRDLSAEPAETRRLTEQMPVASGSAVTVPLRYHRRKDGTVFPVEITGRFFDYGGRPVHIAAIRDITVRRQAEEALRESEERFRDLAESLPLAVFEMDLQGRFTYVNRAALESFGYSREEFAAGVTLGQVISPADRERARAVLARRLAGEAFGYQEYQALRRDGTTFPATVASGPLLRDGVPAGLRGIVVNLTERRQLEEERLKTQKLESIGTLAGGIAHDFNNLLQGVFGYISMAKAALDAQSRPHALLERAEQALHQSVSLTTQLLTFSKGGAPVTKVLALRPVVEGAARFALSGSRLAAEIAFEAGLSTVEADEGQLGQVFQNIVLNAEQAMPGGGTLRIEARNVPASDRPAAPGLAPGPAVAVSFSDQGVGIPPAHLERIFDPYFTTKERGSGLGLATAYSIVHNHGGAITVISEPGRGSTFTVFLPASGAPVAPAAPPATPPPPAGAGARAARVLVMDDEALVRDVVRELLQALGHDAAFAADGEEALALYREAMAAGRPFEVVILDLTIRGGMGGLETLSALRAADPGVTAVVSSGYSDDAGLSEYRRQGFKAYLKKPYVMRELKATLDSLLV